MKRPKVLVLNSSAGIGSRSTSKMAAQSYSRGINQQMCSKLFRYSDWLSRYQHLKLEQLACCVNRRHGTNISNIIISRHISVCHYSLYVLAKFDENRSNLYSL